MKETKHLSKAKVASTWRVLVATLALASMMMPGKAEAQEAWAEYDKTTKTLIFMYGTKSDKSSSGVERFKLNSGDDTPQWDSYAADILCVVFDASFDEVRPTTCHSWFSGMLHMTGIIGLQYLHTDSVTDMMSMFDSCDELAEADLSGFNTQNVTNMQYMFRYCSSLTSLNLTSFDTGRVTSMEGMFHGCSKLTELDLTSFDTRNVTGMSYMFGGCTALATLSPGKNFNTAKVEGMAYMFGGCQSLTSLDVSGLTTDKVKSMDGMFDNCEKLTVLDVSGFNTDNVTSMTYMFDGCKGLTEIDLRGFNTAKVTDMQYMFNGCEGLAELDLSSFNTEKVTDMKYMFNGCANLATLDLSTFNTGNVTEMQSMFNGCNVLAEINLQGFNTAKAINMHSMFNSCKSLTSLNLSKFDTGKVTDMHQMFNTCINLETLKMGPGFNTARVTDMKYMFFNCFKLTFIDLSGFNTACVTDMRFMFCYCSSLTSLDLSDFNTAQVTSMSTMFFGCTGLVTLDLSTFNTAKVTDMQRMFRECTNLKTIYAGEAFTVKGVVYSDNMFNNCTALVGAVENDGSIIDATMANYNTGYFKTYYKVGETQYDMCGETLSADNLVLDDGKDFVALAPFTATTASYSRTMASNWGTLCLPFAVDAASMTDYSFYTLKNVTGDLITLTQLDGTIDAGTPVLVYSDKGSLSVSASNASIVTSPADGTQASGWQLVGSFTEATVPDDGYIISKNKFWLTSDLKNNASVKAVKTKGLRAWLKSGSESSQAKVHVLGFAFDDEEETSAIEAVETIDSLTEGTAEIYDIQGHRTDRLQKGLNIVKLGGVTKKVVVK